MQSQRGFVWHLETAIKANFSNFNQICRHCHLKLIDSLSLIWNTGIGTSVLLTIKCQVIRKIQTERILANLLIVPKCWKSNIAQPVGKDAMKLVEHLNFLKCGTELIHNFSNTENIIWCEIYVALATKMGHTCFHASIVYFPNTLIWRWGKDKLRQY